MSVRRTWPISTEPSFVVTGAAGFVGRRVTRRLQDDGCAVAPLSRRHAAGTMRVDAYARFVPPAGAVLIHCAEPRDVAAAEATGPAYVTQTMDMLADLLRHSWRQVVYLSSAVVYGDDQQHPRRPEEAVAPSGVYGRAKLACEGVVLGVGGIVARLSNVYGPGMAANSVLADILAQIPGRGALRVRDTAPVRDFIWVCDVARAIAALARSGRAGVFNLGTGEGVSIGALAAAALAAGGEADRPVTATAPTGRRSTLVLDITATRAAIGWRPTTTLETGLRRMIQQVAT
jgi:UDP-glucose 4-epimerase